MTVATLTLTEFLLARIAEDEAASICSHGRDCPNRDFSYSPGLTDCNQMTSDPRRWLAECEAKRQIVEAAWHLESFDFPEGGSYGHVVRKQRDILKALAAIYADHDDYRPEWRP